MKVKAFCYTVLPNGQTVAMRLPEIEEALGAEKVSKTFINGVEASSEDIQMCFKKLLEGKVEYLGSEVLDGVQNHIISDEVQQPQGKTIDEIYDELHDDDDEPKYWWQKGQYA